MNLAEAGEDFENIAKGYIDYLLLDKDGRPLVVLEAKKEAIEPLSAKEQARNYARNVGARFAILSNGNVYVADRDNDRIQVFSNAGTYLDQWSVTEVGASYTGPSSLSIYNNRVYVLGESGDEQLVQVFSLDGTPLFTFGGPGSDPGQFVDMREIRVTSDGVVHVFDYGQGNYTVHQFTSEGVFVAALQEYDDGNGIAGIPFISGMAFDTNENFYFTDSSARKVSILNDQEVLVGLLEYNEQEENLFNSPGSIAVSSAKIFVADGGLINVFTYTDDVTYEQEQVQVSQNKSGSAPRRIRIQIEQPPALVCEGGPFLINLRRGNRSDEVRRLQDFLRSQRVYTGPTTGFFGPLTQAGVRSFQLLYQKEILAPVGLTTPIGNWYTDSSKSKPTERMPIILVQLRKKGFLV